MFFFPQLMIYLSALLSHSKMVSLLWNMAGKSMKCDAIKSSILQAPL
jgi:hypothetical protein